MLGIIVPEPTLPLGAMPDELRGAFWGEVQRNMLLVGVLAGVGGGGIGYAMASKKRKGRGVAYGAAGAATAGALVTLLMGWRKIKRADEVYDLVTGDDAPDIFNLSTE